MLYAVRVRGIYATALVALALKKGYLLSDLSKTMLSRVEVPVSTRPPNITVKHGEESRDEIVIHAFPYEAGERFEADLLEEVGHAAVRRSLLGLRSVVDARAAEGCRAEGPGGVLIIVKGGECPQPGSMVRVTVVRSPPGSDVVEGRVGVELTGLTVRVMHPGSGVRISRHLTSEDAAKALKAVEASGIDLNQFSVHIRSGARLASEGDISDEIRRLAREAERLWREGPGGEPAVLSRGEYLSLVYLPSTAKHVMDGLRTSLYPTVNNHHSLKSWSSEAEGLLTDFAEEGVREGLWGGEAGDLIVRFISSRLVGRTAVVLHRRPDGETIRLGPFRVSSYRPSSGRGGEIVLERTFRSPGVYDGLGLERRPGDRGVTHVYMGDWLTIHEYYDKSGRLLGVYANINTPPEVGFQGLKYLDLLVDVVKRPGEEPETIDQGELEKACRSGLLTDRLCEEAARQAERASGLLQSRYP
ncbi:RNA-loop binding protein FAU-1 [Aeropyrum pernix K1]|uniref:Probable ribonuclease FAU-1 n=1 Tax=Aeropyrum pernix (strain ATCC 700893 / DSM 11879 / JCM 9820 / NBRC 100138 / K1) TaxID=272557 RepID=FAU1_AERPE|nr:ribonuclease E/G [Aeropyrum pernix]Q9Y9F2.2 RecName: Full=Probable ribonuclease FAU-1; AltName: Full=RNA-binding protein FAU-1 [Aeropyrum pernix K1]BAA81348.2 RNA-loop binding protein FAU-1 [Aeropyrum pernix K1]